MGQRSERVGFASRSPKNHIYAMSSRFWDLFPNSVINYFMEKLRFITFGRLYTYHIHPETKHIKQKSVKGKS